jgi:hypothetical protein
MVLSGCGKSAVRIGVSLHLLEFSKTYVGYINRKKVLSNMHENLINLTEEELLTQYMIRTADAKIKEAQRTKDVYQKSCSHTHVSVEHQRVDDCGTSPEFYSNMRCLVCGKHWTEKGSK